MKASKSHILLASLLFVGAANAAEHYPNYVIELDWTKESSLEEGITQQCDDTYYPAVEIIVPGKAYEDFQVSMDVDITKGKFSPACEIKFKQGRDSGKFTVNAVGGSCTITVDKIRKDWSEKPQSARYEVNDAC
jgi:hypothetical protein